MRNTNQASRSNSPRRTSIFAIAVVWLIATTGIIHLSSAYAIENWADAKLPVQEGLELWLDASRATGDQPVSTDAHLKQWLDASGKGRHLVQVTATAQPTQVKVDATAVIRFDGVDDHLRAVKQGAELKSFTLIIVAAPRFNMGAFPGLMAMNAAGQRDYTSGLTIDLGPTSTAKFSFLNIEGSGFGSAKNLRTSETPFGRLQTLVVSSEGGDKPVRLAVDDQAEGERERAGDALSLDEITIGARFYNIDLGSPQVTGFSRVDIAEVLLFNRALPAGETEAVRKYLEAKYAGIKNSLPADGESGSELLVSVQNPPAVQMFAPGFSVRELPIELTNINNLKYRADGTLVALAYDGKVWLLRDTNGDGLEDKVDLFWDNSIGLRSTIGMDLTPLNYERGNGLFVVGKTQCILIVDTDGDERADNVIEVAGGWKESFHAVDGLGVAFDKRDGSIYFGRGTYNFADPLVRDDQGVSKYSMTDESAAIIRVSPDFKSREMMCTGIRFPVGLRINREGDLFATDQEGATWVPNGNPFDELLHIQKGRHYGFPARHPKYLPNVIDEPSTFDYDPQHQCTCGFTFNEPVADAGPTFGPDMWRGDAIVTGYSRGKLYKTKLVKTSVGYVAATQLLASLRTLPVDACISPAGDLLVACHSGGPDWGSGPTGKGKLFKVTYTDRERPQPVFVCPSGARELRIEFDRPVDPALLRDVLAESRLTGGRYVRAGDRFESLWPGYAAVQRQKMTPRYDVPLRSVQLSPDRRTLLLATDSLSRSSHYALMLPGMGRSEDDSVSDGALPQQPEIDLAFDLSGCEATWRPADGGSTWTGWLPHWNLQVSKALTTGSATHDALWAAMARPGELVLRGQFDLTDMLRPAVQPGSKLDYEYPPEIVTVSFQSNAPMELTVPKASTNSVTSGNSVSFTLPTEHEKMVPVELRIASDAGSPTLTLDWTTAEDDRPRPLSLRRLLLPWAETSEKGGAESALQAAIPELAGGSWARGRKEFFGEKAACAKCHTIHGRGGNIGPDLSNLIHRDYASVFRDITQPSFAINPDHLTYSVVLGDGRVMAGVIHSSGSKLSVSDTNGKTLEVDRSEVESMAPSPVSTMPEGIVNQIGTERMRDLMTYLLTPPPQMPHDNPAPPPKPRTVAEVKEVLAGAPEPPSTTRPISIVLVAGEKDHGPGEHDYPAWQKVWSELLAAADGVEVSTAWEWPTQEQLDEADVLAFYQRGDWTTDRAVAIDNVLARGGGLVYLHWAVDGRGEEMGHEFAKRIGLAAGAPISYRHGKEVLTFNSATNHPIIRNFDTLELHDESYWKLTGVVPSKALLATAVEEGAPQPQVWTAEPSNGRVFVSIPGHYSWTFDDPLFRLLLLRGIAWAAKEPVDRFNDLVWPGANVAK